MLTANDQRHACAQQPLLYLPRRADRRRRRVAVLLQVPAAWHGTWSGRLVDVVLEVATIFIRPGGEEEFVAAYREARSIVTSTPGFRSIRMTRGIESPSQFVLLVEWDSLDAHLDDFRGTDRFPRWRAHISPHFAQPPHIEHYADV